MKKISILILFLFLSMVFTTTIEAKVLPQAKSAKTSGIVKVSGGSGIGVTPKLRGDKKALTVYFSNLQNASLVSYLLTYQTSTQLEGARGTLNLNRPTSTSELLFGTCSKNVCRYHTGIRDVKLEVNYTLKTGKKYVKRYKIRV